MTLMVMPAVCKAVMALSLPEPGPLTRTSNSLTPNLAAFSAACCAAHWPANGVLLRLPLKPQVPALAQQMVSPLRSVIVTMVLLNVALTCAMAWVTLRRVFFFFAFATANYSPTECPLSQVLNTLLTGNGLFRSLAGPGVGPGTLTTNRQPESMPDAAVTLDVPQTIDVLLHLSA